MRTVVYLDREDEDYAGLHVINKNSQHDILAYEIENVGGEDVLEDWDYLDLEQGYYYADYSVRMESEYCDGYVAYSYGVLDNLVLEPMPFWKGELVSRYYTTKYRIETAGHLLRSLFKKHWSYDADSGGAGLTYTGYIWKTYYYYLIGKDLGWGKPVNKRFYLSGY